jgi:hypothetical protein
MENPKTMACARALAALLLGVLLGASAPSGPSRGSGFREIQLSDKFWTEGVAVADVNRDGVPDVIAMPFWYEGPDFKTRHAIAPADAHYSVTDASGHTRTIDGFEGYPLGTKTEYADAFLSFAWDINQDGYPDVLTIGYPGKPAYWFENPEGAGRPWTRHPAFDVVNTENPAFADLFQTGGKVLVFSSNGRIGYGDFDPKDADGGGYFHPISPDLRLANGVITASGSAT